MRSYFNAVWSESGFKSVVLSSKSFSRSEASLLEDESPLSTPAASFSVVVASIGATVSFFEGFVVVA